MIAAAAQSAEAAGLNKVAVAVEGRFYFFFIK